MTRAEKVAEAQRLRGKGLTYKAIGETLGVTPACVYKWLHPEWTKAQNRQQNARPARKKAKRAWENDPTNRGQCERCGKSRGKGVLRDGLCHECVSELSQERRVRFVALRKQGLNNAQIAEREGVSRQVVTTEIYRALHWDGMDVPTSPYWSRAKQAA